MELERYAKAVAKMTEEGRLDEALEIAREAVSHLEGPSEGLATWLAHLGEIHDLRAESEEAEACFRRAIATLDQLSVPKTSLRVRALTGLSKVNVKLGRLGDAEENASTAVALIEQSPDATATSLVFALRNLAAVCLLQRDLDAAERVLERVVQTLGTALAPDDPELATALTDLAYVYEERGRGAEAVHLREDAATILATPYRRLGEQVEELMKETGMGDAELAVLAESAAAGNLANEFLPDPRMNETVEELAFLLFARPRESASQTARHNAWMVERVKGGELSMRDVIEQLALSAGH